MKKFKKLIPALCMLLVSAVMLGSTTFAWFSMNTKVTASNMEVKATASRNLLISKTSADADDYSASVDMLISKTSLVPVTTIGGDTTSPVFSKILSVGTSMTQDNAARGEDTTYTTATVNTDYVKTTIWLKCVGEDASNLKVKINTTTGGEKKLDPAIRVMIVDHTNTKTYIYSPIANAAYITSGKAGASVNAADSKLVMGNITTAAIDTTVILSNITRDTAYQFDIYAWYEGEDVNCKATNTLDMAAYKFAIDFTVE